MRSASPPNGVVGRERLVARQAQLLICLVGALAILGILWLNGGRDANREPRSKGARWAAVFAEESTQAALFARRPLLSARAQKCQLR